MAELKIIGMDEVAVEEIEWLWYPYIDFDFTACSIVVTGR